MQSPALRWGMKSLQSYNPIPNGCILYLPLWHPSLSGGTFKSIDLYGEAVTVNGATKVADGFSFDGTNDNIILPASWFPTTEGTIVMTVKWDSSTGLHYLLSADLNEVSIFSGNAAGGTLYFYWDGGIRMTEVTGWTDSALVNLIITYIKNGVCLMYADGVEVNDGSCPDTTPTNTAARLGEGTDGTSDATCTIYEYAQYNRILSPSEALYWSEQTKRGVR